MTSLILMPEAHAAFRDRLDELRGWIEVQWIHNPDALHALMLVSDCLDTLDAAEKRMQEIVHESVAVAWAGAVDGSVKH
jgi:hypothetical protein